MEKPKFRRLTQNSAVHRKLVPSYMLYFNSVFMPMPVLHHLNSAGGIHFSCHLWFCAEIRSRNIL